MDNYVMNVAEIVINRRDIPHFIVTSDMKTAEWMVERLLPILDKPIRAVFATERRDALLPALAALEDGGVLIASGIAALCTGWQYNKSPILLTSTAKLPYADMFQLSGRCRHPGSEHWLAGVSEEGAPMFSVSARRWMTDTPFPY